MTVQRPLTDEELSKLSKGELSNDLFRFNLQQRSLVATGENVPARRLDLAKTDKGRNCCTDSGPCCDGDDAQHGEKLDNHEDSQGSTEHHKKGGAHDPSRYVEGSGTASDELSDQVRQSITDDFSRVEPDKDPSFYGSNDELAEELASNFWVGVDADEYISELGLDPDDDDQMNSLDDWVEQASRSRAEELRAADEDDQIDEGY